MKNSASGPTSHLEKFFVAYVLPLKKSKVRFWFEGKEDVCKKKKRISQVKICDTNISIGELLFFVASIISSE